MSTHPTVLPLGYSEAAMFLRSPGAEGIIGLISIHSPTEPSLVAPVSLRLDLLFDDTDIPDLADPLAAIQDHIRRRTAAELGRTCTPPTQQDVERIIQFARPLQHRTGILLIHCSAGISRSPAAALICLAAWTPPGQEGYCVQTLRQIRPASQPHPSLIQIADTLLHRNGNLLAATTRRQ